MNRRNFYYAVKNMFFGAAVAQVYAEYNEPVITCYQPLSGSKNLGELDDIEYFKNKLRHPINHSELMKDALIVYRLTRG